jgi:peptide/nickel transport system substrate-binding protein
VFRRIAISLVLLCLAGIAGARTRPRYGGVVRIETQRDLWQGSDAIARQLTMDGLTRIDVDGIAKPALAVQWSSQSGDHHWEFKLRANVHFHDGTPLTADAVIASLAAACNDSCPWRTVRAVGQSVVFTSDSPEPDLPAQLARAKFLISRRTADGALLGTGSFSASGSTDGVARFVANEDCWSGKPFLDAVEIHPRRSVRDQWLDLSVGKADIVEVPSGLLRIAQQQHLKTISSGPVDLLALQITKSGVLANEKLRQAIALGVDRSALFNVIFQKQGEVTASLLAGYQSGYSFLFATDRNLDRAAELRGGANPQVSLSSEDSNPELQLTAERIAINLREAGFRVQVISGESSRADIVLRRLRLEEPEARAALDAILENSTSSVVVGSADPEAVYRAERDFLEQFTLVPLLYLPRSYAVSERVRDLRLAADGTPILRDVAVDDPSVEGSGASQ